MQLANNEVAIPVRSYQSRNDSEVYFARIETYSFGDLKLLLLAMVVEKSVLRIAARDIRMRLLTISDNFEFFTKTNCREEREKNQKNQDASMKSLMEQMGVFAYAKTLTQCKLI